MPLVVTNGLMNLDLLFLFQMLLSFTAFGALYCEIHHHWAVSYSAFVVFKIN
jgi:hypothetical protein